MSPVADLHCDLLLYLATDGRTPYNPESRCSIPQMRDGGVRFQALPMFTETNPHSSLQGKKQAAIFAKLPSLYPEFGFVNEALDTQIAIQVAIENASSFCAEGDNLQEALKWLERFPHKPLYISLTWNSENRFGGGALTDVGLKEDGRALLDFFSGKNTAIDLSHASDRLAEEIFMEIDKKRLNLRVIASHSNFRAIADVPRNLPDHLAQEIFRRGGVIGLNFVGRFIGPSYDKIFDHIAHGKKLGGEKQLCFGADFFFDHDLPVLREWSFFDELSDSSCYPKRFPNLNLFFDNAMRFLC